MIEQLFSVVNPYLLAGLLIFAVGTFLLSRTRAKRYLFFFMIHTRHGLRFVDSVAKLSPGLWKFLGDLAISISFGGLGTYYVSRYRNTWLITGIIGVVSLVFTYITAGPVFALAGLLVLVIGIMLLRKNNKPFYHFLAGMVVVGVLMYNIYPFFAGVEALRPYVSLLVGVFGIPAFLISLLLSHALEIIIEQSTIPGVSPMLPGISDGGLVFFFPGTGIEIDFWQALIAIIVLLVPHEFAHGVMSRCHGIKVKSAGILTAGPVPIGAFVEPDDKAMKRHEGKERMRIFAAGSFTNLIVSAIALILFISMTPLVSTISEPAGIMITNVVDGTPASDTFERGFVITEIDGTETLDVVSFLSALKDIKPDQTVTFVTSNGTFDITLDEHPENSSRGYIGIDLRETYDRKEEFKNEYRLQADAVLFALPTLFWIFFLCFNIAIVNLLPITPFDGGKMFEEYMAEFRIKKKRKDQIQKLVIFIILALLLVNAFPLINVIAP